MANDLDQLPDTRPQRHVTIREVAVILGWNRQRAGRWLRKQPGARKGTRGYILPLARLLESFPEAAMDAMEMSKRLGTAADLARLERRLLSAEARVRSLEQTVRRMRAERRKQLARNRRLRNLQDRVTKGE